jgi:hypothetical protein
MNREQRRRLREHCAAKKVSAAEQLDRLFTPPPVPEVKKVPYRLPHGAEMVLMFNEFEQVWLGRLNIAGCPTFTAKARALFTTCCRLDARYRAWLGGRDKQNGGP